MRKLSPIVIFISILFLIACASKKETNSALAQNWQLWKNNYNKEVFGKDGWHNLAGLYWLNEGPNTIGSSEAMDHQFPADTPTRIGNIRIKDDTAHFFAFDYPVFNSDTKVSAIPLSIEEPTRLSFDHYSFFLIKREKGFAIRLINDKLIKDDDLKAGGFKLSFYPFSEKWIVPAKLMPNTETKKIRMATVYGTTREEESAGILFFAVNGKNYQLEAVSYGKDKPMYVMFSDNTNSDTTYGAGRYVQVFRPNKNGLTYIDFNQAYNPPCAYTPYATCPLTPKQNVLPISIEAGELDYKAKP